MSVTLGVSFTMRGRRLARLMPSTTRAAASGSAPNESPPSSTLGQEMLASKAATPGAPSSLRATSAYSSQVRPTTLTMTGTPRRASQGRSSASRRSTPGFSSPMELSIPAGVSTVRGGGFPGQGSRDVPFTTTAPRAVRSTRSAYSRP